MRNVSLQPNCGLDSHHGSWYNQAIALADNANMVGEVGRATSPDKQDIIGGDILGSLGDKGTVGRMVVGAYEGAGLKVLSCNGGWAAYCLIR